MGARMRALDWATTPLGPVETWPQSLRSAVSILLPSGAQIVLFWGPDLVALYNDAYRPVFGTKHPSALGMPARECWKEIWDDALGPLFRKVLDTGEAFWAKDYPFSLVRHGFLEETYFDISYDPVRDESGGVGGIFCIVTETTGRVIGERRLRVLRELAARAGQASSASEACAFAGDVLLHDEADLPFAVIFLTQPDGSLACARAIGIDERDACAASWPVARVALTSVGEVVGSSAVVLPIPGAGNERPLGVFVAGLSPRLPLSEDYRGFLDLVAGQLGTGLIATRAYEAEVRRAEALAELDRAKTAFFSNVSHELRTPLTLMLGPMEDALEAADQALRGEDLVTAHRNALRLLKLVNTLLEFSRIEAGRVQASYEPTDLALLTTDLASTFRAAIERGGLVFEVACEPLPEPVYVDRGMWERIVLNLLSNALKFTFEGSIRVELRAVGDRVELSVSDTGAGIAAADQSVIFDRFHRVEGVRARTHEGSGIGLALVRDLVTLHGGEVRVDSEPGVGTTFVVSLPSGSRHLPAERVRARARAATGVGDADLYVAEAMQWLPAAARESTPVGALTSALLTPGAPSSRILVVDDNADMRDYLTRLLQPHWAVDTARDGAEALAFIHERVPDLIVTDVMMPNVDGVSLLRAVRDEPRTASVPVILLSARAGEDSRVEGLTAGAADYLVKPFAARELVARVSTHLELGRLRRAAEAANRAKDEFLARLGHELRNPLAPIATALHLLRLRFGNTGEAERGIIERQVRHLVALVNDLLDVSRITTGKIEIRKQRLALADVVATAIEMASPLLDERRHHLSVDVPRRPELEVDADPDRLAQVVSNLVTNAAKYTEPGGAVSVVAVREDGEIVLTVRDTGVGIAPAMLARVFEPFAQESQTLERSRGGLGLGLAIVRSLVALHGGSVHAQSEGAGQGSTFVVRLPPAAAGSMSALPASDAPVAATAREGHRVLLVDDNVDAARLLSEWLGAMGHTVRVVDNGLDALSVARTFAPAVALLDIGLPGMDGYEVGARLRELLPAIAIIAVTGYGQETDRERSRSAGFDVHLVKPIDVEALDGTIRAIVAG